MSLHINIRDLINGRTIEWERIEFKEGFNEEDIIHTICAFANDYNNWGGGYIIVGIKENNGRPILPPLGLPEEQVDSFQKKLRELYHKIEPFYSARAQPFDYDGRTILVIWVLVGDDRPYRTFKKLGQNQEKKYFIRSTSNSVIANFIEERKLFEISTKIHFENRMSNFGTVEDINIDLIADYLKRTNSSLYKNVYNIPFKDLCRNMKIVKGSDEDLRPLNIALLFFNANPHNFFPGALIELTHFNENGTFTEKKLTGPIDKQLSDALNYLSTNVIAEQVSSVYNKAESLRIKNYPYHALEEAIVNAVYHRGYDVDNKTEIRINPDSIEIISYPGAMPPVDEEQLIQFRLVPRSYRNSRVGDFLKELHLTEGKALGIPRIKEETERNGNPVPNISLGRNNDYFLVKIGIHVDWVVNSPNSNQVIFDRLTDLQQQLLDYCKNLRTAEDIFKNFSNHSKLLLTKELNFLRDEEYLGELIIKKFLFIEVAVYSTSAKGTQALKYSY